METAAEIAAAAEPTEKIITKESKSEPVKTDISINPAKEHKPAEIKKEAVSVLTVTPILPLYLLADVKVLAMAKQVVDTEIIYKDINFWYSRIPLLKPTNAWEFVQIGNCGSPIETPEGWLVLSHGVGAMRRYSLGAFLLDLDNPTRVIGRLKEPFLVPDEKEREGYVPNVLYSCGAIAHNGRLILPYAMSDSSCSFASVDLSDLTDAMKKT